MKIAVLGHSGSGKSTLAKWIGNFYSLPVLYLDTVYFTSGWQERNPERQNSDSEKSKTDRCLAAFINKENRRMTN